MNLPRYLQWWRPAQPPRMRRPAVPDWVSACGEPSETQLDEALPGLADARRRCGG